MFAGISNCRIILDVIDVCLGMNIMVDDTIDVTTWFRSAQNSVALLFNGLQLYRQNDSLVVLFVTGNT